MDLRDTAEEASFRAEVRAFIAEHRSKGAKTVHPEDPEYARKHREAMAEWRSALVGRGWIAPAWPREWGGAGLTMKEQFILNQELAEAGLENQGGLGVMMLGPTLLVHGTPEQQREHLAGILSGEVVWCQGWSEPGAGSDLASLQTRAIRDGDEYVINGQKIWTSSAQIADKIYMLARTDPDAPKHRGISLLMVEMKQPGVTVRPLTTIANTRPFNEVFFEDVRTPVRNRIGEENRGWYVGMTLTDYERSNIGSNVGARRVLQSVLAVARTQPEQDVPGLRSSTWRLEFADRWVEAEVSLLFARLNITIQANQMVPNYEASMAKLFLSETNQRIARTRLKLYGLKGLLWDRDREEADRGAAVRNYLDSIASTIGGGTSEIQRNIIATRGLGLPRG